ncbi:MAG: hypothetical protein KDC35_07805 [Acidobacteria bacterium]|nr:hypothetical protein [Acidobacteriota bacterium]
MRKEEKRHLITWIARILFTAALVLTAYTLFQTNTRLKAKGSIVAIGNTGSNGLPITIEFVDQRFENNVFDDYVAYPMVTRVQVGSDATVLFDGEDPKATAQYYDRVEVWLWPVVLFACSITLFATRGSLSVAGSHRR